ncbi:MAG: YncE family protein [Planctomycetota bacterium]
MTTRSTLINRILAVCTLIAFVFCIPDIAADGPTETWLAPGGAQDADGAFIDAAQGPYTTIGPVVRLSPPTDSGNPFSPRDGVSAPLNLEFISVGVPPEGDTPSELAFTPDGAKIIIAHRDSQNLVVFDANTREVLQTIALSGSPNSLAITPDGLYAVTANIFEDTASIVDLTTGTEIHVVDVGDQPGIVRATPDSSLAIVGNSLDSTFSAVDIATGVELRQISDVDFAMTTSWGSWGVTYRFTDFEITPDSNTVIFPEMFDDQVCFFDITWGTAVNVATQPSPAAVDMSPDGMVAVVLHGYPQTWLTVLDVPGQSVTKTINIGIAPYSSAVAIEPTKTKAVIVGQNACRVVNIVTDAVSGDLSTGSPNFLKTSADGQYCVVGNYRCSIISYASETIVAQPMYSTTPDALAVSPAGPRAATAHALRKENMEVLNTNGAASYLEEVVPTGPPPEGDKARGVAITPDGSRAIVINNHSQNATIIDLVNMSIEEVVPVGERPGGVAITPDGTTAVVANLDSYHTTVIDLTTYTATDISMGRRAGELEISPDGQYAYLPVVADGDGVWRINLDTLAVDGPKLLTGNMGGIGFVFDQASGVALSHDGATLVTCGSFDDNISIIDTASWTEVARVMVGDFPVRAVFSNDDATIYVTNKTSGTVSVVNNAGGGSSVIDTIAVGNSPWEMALHPAGGKLYVGVFDDRTIAVVDLPANVVSNVIALPQPSGAGQSVGLQMAADGHALYVACNGADFHVIHTATETIVDTLNTGLAPTELKFSDVNNSAYMPSPYGDDGISIVRLAGLGDMNCDGIVNSYDIDGFICALSPTCDYEGTWGHCARRLADCNGDGIANSYDIDRFIEIVGGG